MCDTLRKGRVRALVAAPSELTDALADNEMESVFINEPWAKSLFFGDLEPRTLYKLVDFFDLCYLYLQLPETEEPTVLLVGPYLMAPPEPERLLSLGEQRGVSPSRQKYFEEYYTGIPVLTENNHLLLMVSTFCERIWNCTSFAVVDVNKKHHLSVSPINEPTYDNHFDDVLLNIKALEMRYAFENEMIRAVELGQIHKEPQLLAAFSEQMFESRIPDQLRNAKNYGIIMNTLLRKAAERGGVHPVYLDRVSSGFAAKIEGMSDLSKNNALMREMFRSYCRLVRRHSLVGFSLVVQKTVLLIESDLSATLSLKSLADSLNISPGYLSTIFKKDTGKTISEYIREKRIKHAANLLATTQMQIQTIALHCGIMDLQYFSKTFKRLTGKTPKEYRESILQPKMM